MAYQHGSPSDVKRKKAVKDAAAAKAGEKPLGPGVTRNPHPRAGGRGIGAQPAFIIDEDKLMQLAETMCSIDEIALILSVPRKFLMDHYLPVIHKGQANAKSNLRAVQFANARGGNVIMQIWLGKQYLGQKDKSEIGGPDGKPIPIEKTKRTIAYIPDNGRQVAAKGQLDQSSNADTQ